MSTIKIIFMTAFIAFIMNTANSASAETVTYIYDSMQRLVRAQYSGGAVIDYVYDTMGNRLARSLSVAAAPANSAPLPAASPSPASGATGITGPLTVSWTGSDPNLGDRLSFFVYAGTNANALQLIWSGSTTSFSPWGLLANSTYFWKVVTRDNHNAETSGPVWNFTTGNAVVNGLPVNLAVYLAGTGGGTVTSSPQGIVCTGLIADTCAHDFPFDTSVTLIAVIDGTSRFGGWSVAACATNPSCTFALTEESLVSSRFDGVPPIRLLITIPFLPPEFQYPPVELDLFSEVAPMFSLMPFSMQMQTTDRIFIEDIDFNSGTQEVLWQGGYSGDFLSVTGTTRLQGILTITGGKLIVERIVIR